MVADDLARMHVLQCDALNASVFARFFEMNEFIHSSQGVAPAFFSQPVYIVTFASGNRSEVLSYRESSSRPFFILMSRAHAQYMHWTVEGIQRK